MYVAFTWLLCLTTFMWLCICIFDVYIQEYSIKDSTVIERHLFWNTSYACMTPRLAMTESHRYENVEVQLTLSQWPMFLAGALAVTLIRNMPHFFFYSKIISSIFNRNLCSNVFLIIKAKFMSLTHLPYLNEERLKITRINICHTTCRYMNAFWRLVKVVKSKSRNNDLLKYQLTNKSNKGETMLNMFRLETLAKNRLTKHMADIKRSLNENRSRYLHFQDKYLRTHQENVTLRAQVRNLSTEMEENQKKLRELVFKIYQSKNSYLIQTCKRHDGARAGGLGSGSSVPDASVAGDSGVAPAGCGSSLDSFGDIRNTCVHLVKGEMMYTLKNKDGFIEKVYDIQANCGGGETIRRIREYSVHCDIDLLQDCVSGCTQHLLQLYACRPDGRSASEVIPLPDQHFLTRSPAFRSFMSSSFSAPKSLD